MMVFYSILLYAVSQTRIDPLPGQIGFFPAATQFSPVPSGNGWKGEPGPLAPEVAEATIENMIAHGFTGIEGPTRRPPEEERLILEYAQSRGMFVTWHTGALEGFGRDTPPVPCVYAPEYPETVRDRAESALTPLRDIPRLYNVFTYQDEPFTGGPRSFGFTDEVKREFRRRYGYELPEDLDLVRGDPGRWRDLIEFRTAKFPDAWRHVYRAVKEVHPGFRVTLTHDSHNTFGAGRGSHAEIAIDDVFHWGGDFADLFVFDMYPYMMFDFRFGECSRLPKPRISQTHYAFAQMRALTRAYNRDLGFWVGTYNPAWFGHFLCPELAAMHWSEREMSMTAAAAGANYLLTGYNIPVDAAHWEAFGQGLRLLQKAGGGLVRAPKVKARACMLFPRTQYVQLQREYFNVGLSFELFLRAFGELDILHEDQVKYDTMGGYDVLLLFDVELLPRKVAEHIAGFAARGGVVIADCLPQLDENRRPLDVLGRAFGVEKGATGRILRTGSWVPYRDMPPEWFSRSEKAPDETVFETDVFRSDSWTADPAQGMGDFLVVSPRENSVKDGEVLARLESGRPAVIRSAVGKGWAYLLGFCTQDTYFNTWRDENTAHRESLRALFSELTRTAGIRPHVRSANPDIEASIRANEKEGFLFVINHEAADPETCVELRDLAFPIGRLVNLDDDADFPAVPLPDGLRIDVTVPLGEARLFHVLPG